MKRLLQQNIINSKDWQPYLFLLLISLIAYWPISLQLFSLKNDALHYFLPLRYSISNSVQHGTFPYWDNSFYLGYPIHGDMQSGVWNPFVLISSIFTTYNATIFNLEYLFYIFLAGAGMFKLTGLFSSSLMPKIMVATAYIFSGYILGSGQFINWIASAAFIPFILFYYYRFLETNETITVLKTALAVWLLFVCGYPADSIFTAYLLLAMLVTAVVKNRQLIFHNKPLLKKYAVHHFLLLVAVIALSAPALISYLELLPYYNRGGGISFATTIENSFELKNSLSLISPWSIVANDFKSATDVTGRNLYMGIYVVLFAATSFFLKSNYQKLSIQIFALFAFLFSLGEATPLRKICYHLLPGMDTFRHPSHFRLYFILFLLLLALISADRFLKNDKAAKKFLCINSYVLTGIIIIVLIFNISTTGFTKLLDLPESFSTRSMLKEVIQNFSWKELLFMIGLLQILFLLFFNFFLWRDSVFKKKWFLLLHLINLFIGSLLVLPVTFAGKTRPSTINQLISKTGANYDPVQFNKSIWENSTGANDHFDELGLSFFYSHNPGITKNINTPSIFSHIDSFVKTETLYNYVIQKPVAWLSNKSFSLKDTNIINEQDTSCRYSFFESHPANTGRCEPINGYVSITAVKAGKFTMIATTEKPCILNFTQAYHHNWKVSTDGKAQPITKTNLAFMSIPLPEGTHSIVWEYIPRKIYFSLVVSFLAALFICIFILNKKLKNIKPGRKHE